MGGDPGKDNYLTLAGRDAVVGDIFLRVDLGEGQEDDRAGVAGAGQGRLAEQLGGRRGGPVGGPVGAVDGGGAVEQRRGGRGGHGGGGRTRDRERLEMFSVEWKRQRGLDKCLGMCLRSLQASLVVSWWRSTSERGIKWMEWTDPLTQEDTRLKTRDGFELSSSSKKKFEFLYRKMEVQRSSKFDIKFANLKFRQKAPNFKMIKNIRVFLGGGWKVQKKIAQKSPETVTFYIICIKSLIV